jgi:HK97 family phage portal protein
MSFASSLFAVAYGPSQSISTDGWISSFFSGAEKTFAGTSVNEQIALQVTAVYRAIALISDAVAGLPIDVIQRVGDRREERPDHPVAALLRRPNDLMTSVDLRCAEQTHALQYGNAYVDIQRNQGGDPIALWPLLPDRTRAVGVKEPNGERVIAYETVVDGDRLVVDPKDVAHIHGLSFDGIRGYSPLQLARQAVGLALGLEEFGSKFFGNDAKSGGLLEHPGRLSDKARENLSKSMGVQGGLSNAHRVKVLEEGMKFNATTIAPEDSQFLLTRSFQVEEIARLYGVPLHMLQSQAKSTSWGSGIAQMSLGFLIYTIAPWLVRWEQELERKLLTEAELDGGFYLKFNVNALLRADAATRASFYAAALNKATGWLARDEVRALEDLNPDGIENEAAAPVASSFGAAPEDEDIEDEDIEDEE